MTRHFKGMPWSAKSLQNPTRASKTLPFNYQSIPIIQLTTAIYGLWTEVLSRSWALVRSLSLDSKKRLDLEELGPKGVPLSVCFGSFLLSSLFF